MRNEGEEGSEGKWGLKVGGLSTPYKTATTSFSQIVICMSSCKLRVTSRSQPVKGVQVEFDPVGRRLVSIRYSAFCLLQFYSLYLFTVFYMVPYVSLYCTVHT